MKWWLLALLFIAACASNTDLDPELHGTLPAAETNVPEGQGLLEVTAEPVIYYQDVEGYLARPTPPGTYPGIVMIHEWWGLNENVKTMAQQLAAYGYVVLAVDLYNGKVATIPQEAQTLVGAFDPEEGVENMRAAVAYLREDGSPTVGSLGWCFGGAQSLQIGLAEDLDATVIYYGRLVTDPELLSALDQPVLGIFGAEDTSIPVEQVEEFEQSLQNLGIESSIHVYEGAGHAFANPSGDRYVAEAADDAWQKTTKFLAENLG